MYWDRVHLIDLNSKYEIYYSRIAMSSAYQYIDYPEAVDYCASRLMRMAFFVTMLLSPPFVCIVWMND